MYAIACSKGLNPEVEAAARLTLGHPLTFKSLGDSLRLFEGWALHNLAEFRLRSMHSLCSNWKSLLDCLVGPSKIWVNCPTAKDGNDDRRRLPPWLLQELDMSNWSGPFGSTAFRFTETIPTLLQIRVKYMRALWSHVKEKDCNFCTKVHIMEADKFFTKMNDILAQAWNVPISMSGERPWDPKNSS